MVIYSNTPIDASRFVDFDDNEDLEGGWAGVEGEGTGTELIEGSELIGNRSVKIAIGNCIVPDGGSYGTCNASLNIRLVTTPQIPLFSLWKCKSAISNDTGLPIPSSAYTFSVTGTGATFTTTSTECGVYEIEVTTMFGTHILWVLMNAPSIDTPLELQVFHDQTGTQIPSGGSGYIALEPGVHLFAATPLDPTFSDYRMAVQYHWSLTDVFQVGGGSIEVVDWQGNPTPDGEFCKVTIAHSGLFSLWVYATCPELPSLESITFGFDIGVGVE